MKKPDPWRFGAIGICVIAVCLILGITLVSRHQEAARSKGAETGTVLALKAGKHSTCTLHLKPAKAGAKSYWAKQSYTGHICAKLPPAAGYERQTSGALRHDEYVMVYVKRKFNKLPSARTPEHYCRMTAYTDAVLYRDAHIIEPDETTCDRYTPGMQIRVVQMGAWADPVPTTK